jgi:hypothetical protein
MKTISGLMVVAGLSLAGATLGQSQAMPNPAEPAASTPDQANSATYPHKSVRSAAADGVREISTGMVVKARSGQPMGTVAAVVPNAAGDPAYVVINEQNGTRTTHTAMPYAAARHMVHENEIVVDGQKLKGAPRVSDRELQNSASTGWQTKMDNYWSKPAAAADSG